MFGRAVLAAFLVFFTVSCSSHSGRGDETASQPPLLDVAACEAQGGEVRPAGLLGAERCIRPYSDAGRSCADSSECEGRCLATDWTGDETTDNASRGVCEADDNPFGCFAEINGGIVGLAICVD